MKKSQVFKLIQECKDTNSPSLELTNLNIVVIPDEVFQLRHLKKLSITKNKVKHIQPEIGNLVNLEFLGLNYNQIEYLPREIGKLTNLKSLDLWNNKLKSLPIDFSKLTKLEYIHLGFNQLNTIPIELFYLFSQLKGIDLQSNPFEDLPILNRLELVDLITYFRSENSFFGIIEVPKGLQVAFQQYLNFFTEFVEKSTGEEVPFEVVKVSNGLKITAQQTTTLKIEKINSLLKQYVNFLRQDLSGVKGAIEKEFLLLKIEEQKKHFESQIKFLEFENKYLKEKFDEVLTSHLDLSGKAILRLSGGNNPSKLVNAIKQELTNFQGENRNEIEEHIEELELILKTEPKDSVEVKSKFKVIQDLVIGASGSTISTGLIELFKLFI